MTASEALPEIAPGTVMFTITTHGYLSFTLNLHASLARLGLGDRLAVFSLDEEAHEALSRAGVVSRLHRGGGLERYSDFQGPGFAGIVARKFVIACGLLQQHRKVLFVDSDIVFLRDPVPLMIKLMTDGDLDLVMQQEHNFYFNTGFWLARSAPNVLDLFQLMSDALTSGRANEEQFLFNLELRQRSPLKVVGLDKRLFAYGDVIFSDPTVSKVAYILHFNSIVGRENKREKMRECGAILHPSLGEPGDSTGRNRLYGTGVDDIRALTPERLRRFHEVECHDGKCFRWAAPTAYLRVDRNPGDHLVTIDMSPLQKLWGGRLQTHINERPVLDQSRRLEGGRLEFKISREDFDASREHWLKFEFGTTPTPPSGDSRALGAPIFSILIEPLLKQLDATAGERTGHQ